jgi:hypothetical protein
MAILPGLLAPTCHLRSSWGRPTLAGFDRPEVAGHPFEALEKLDAGLRAEVAGSLLAVAPGLVLLDAVAAGLSRRVRSRRRRTPY